MEFSLVLAGVAAIWAVAVITPGPNLLVTVHAAVAGSRRTALLVSLGLMTGTVVWGAAGFFGVTLVFAAAPWLYAGLKLVAATYLVWLGLQLLLRRKRRSAETVPAKGGTGDVAAWRLGLLTCLANPKTAAFVASLFAATLPPAPGVTMGLASVALMTAISGAWYTGVACLFSQARWAALYRRFQAAVDRLAGGVFVGFGAGLAADV